MVALFPPALLTKLFVKREVSVVSERKRYPEKSISLVHVRMLNLIKAEIQHVSFLLQMSLQKYTRHLKREWGILQCCSNYTLGQCCNVPHCCCIFLYMDCTRGIIHVLQGEWLDLCHFMQMTVTACTVGTRCSNSWGTTRGKRNAQGIEVHILKILICLCNKLRELGIVY